MSDPVSQFPPILYKLQSRAKKPTINADGSVTVHSLDDMVLEPGRIIKVPTGLSFLSRDQIRKCSVLSLDCEFRNPDLPFVMMPGVYPMLGNEIKIAVFSVHARQVLLPFGTPLAKMVMIETRAVHWEEMPVYGLEDTQPIPMPSAVPLEEEFARR